MSDARLCVVKVIDDHGVEQAALLGLNRLERVGWEGDGSTIGRVMVEVWEEPTRHYIEVKKLLSWLKAPGKFPPEEQRKAKLRKLAE
jgi:hypothetical protein